MIVGAFGSDWSIPRLNPDLARGVEIMLANLEQPLSIGKVAEHLALKEWRLRRLFHRYLAMSPRAYYLELRLDQARNLLRNSHESVATVRFHRSRESEPGLQAALRGIADLGSEPVAAEGGCAALPASTCNGRVPGGERVHPRSITVIPELASFNRRRTYRPWQ